MVEVSVLARKQSTSTEASNIYLPENYQGRFQILPDFADLDASEPTQSRPMTILEILKHMPKSIKVIEFEPTKQTKRVQLWVGSVLEVLGTTERSTKQGIQSFLRVKKNHNVFVLPPDFKGHFQPCENQTLTIGEILQKFSLPQRLLMVQSENHGQLLLDMVSSSKLNSNTFLLRRRTEVEFVIGVDNEGLNSVVIDIDSRVNFHPPINKNKSDIMFSKSGLRIDDLDSNQLICKSGAKLIICKPWGDVFRIPPPVLNVKRPSSKRKKERIAEFDDNSDSDGYERIPFGTGSDDLHKDGSGSETDDCSDGYEHIPPGNGNLHKDEPDEDDIESEAEYCSGSDGYERIGGGGKFQKDEFVEDDRESCASSRSDGYERNLIGAKIEHVEENSEQEANLDSDGYLRPNVPEGTEATVRLSKATSPLQSSLSFPTTEELPNLSIDEVADLLEALHFSSVVQEKFKEQNVNGILLIGLDIETLKADFGFSPFHARKLMKFVAGWRPSLLNQAS